MHARFGIVMLLLAVAATANAEDAFVYETFAGVEIGRVFLTPGDRDRLDERRLSQPAGDSASSETLDSDSPKKVPRASAGYIISSSGRARVWLDGDFVEAPQKASQSLRFPGDIKVTRTRTESGADNEDRQEPELEAVDNAD